jgi:lysophospholipase L1-like esterase
MSTKTLDAMQISNPTANIGTSGTVRYYADGDFTASGGTQYMGGGLDSTDYFLSNTWSVTNGILTVPSIAVPSTDDAIANDGVRITAAIYDSNGVRRGILFDSFRIYNSLSSPITLTQLVLANGARQQLRETGVWTKEQVIDYFNTVAGTLNDASTTVKGRTRLSVAPATPTEPIAVGDNDSRLNTVSTGTPLNEPSSLVRRTSDGHSAHTSLDVSGGYMIDGTTVLSEQLASISNATNATDVITNLNLLLTGLRSTGMVAPLPPSPDTIGGLQLWYKADALSLSNNDPISSFTDSSGNARHATQTGANRPLYNTNQINSLPAVTFDGTDDYFNFASTTFRTVFVVFKAGVTPFASFAGLIGGDAGAPGSGIILYGYSGTTSMASGTGFSAAYRNSLSVADVGGAHDFAPTTSWQIGSFVLLANQTHTGMLGLIAGGARYWNGQVAEVLVYNTVLSQANRYVVEDYLFTKYAIGSQRPIGQIIFDGNSLTAGTGSTGGLNYPNQAISLLAADDDYYTYSNFGVGGQSITSMIADAATQVDVLYDTAKGRNIVVMWEGTNEQSYAKLHQYCVDRKAAGFKVVMLTILPSMNHGAGFEATRQAINTQIRADSSADAIADVAASALIGDEADASNLTYYTDGTHLTNAGYAVVAAIVKTAIQSIP